MKWLSKLRESKRTDISLKIVIGTLLFAYVFSITSFGERNFKTIQLFNYGYFFVYISMILLILFVFIHLFLFHGRLSFSKVSLFIPSFVVFALISTIIYSKNIRGWISLVLLCVTFFIFIYLFRIFDNKFLILSIICASLFAFSLFFLVYHGTKIFHFKAFLIRTERLGSEFDNQNGVAAFAAVTVGLSLYLLLFFKNKLRFLFIISLILSTWVGISTGSRTFLIASYIFGALLFFFFFKKHRVLYVVALILATILGLFLLNTFLDNGLLKAFQTLIGTATKNDGATISRMLYSDYGLLLGSRNILIGYGYNGFNVYSGIGTYAHNNYAEVLCNFGIIGMILFYLPLALLLYRCTRKKRIDKPFIISFVAYYLVVSFSNILYYKKMYFLILALMFYLAFDESPVVTQKYLVPSLQRVLFVCDSMGSGGAEKVISSLSNQMNKNGITVSILGVADYTGHSSFYPLDENVVYIPLTQKNNKKLHPINRVFRIRRMIKVLKPDVVISFLPNANIYAWLSLIGKRIPHVVSERNNPYLDPKEKIIRLLKKISFVFADGCVFQTQDAMNFYCKETQQKSTIIKNPIVLNQTLNCEKTNQIKNSVVLAVGRLIEQKNYKCLLDAFKIFNEKQNHNFILKIYGDGPLKDNLLEYCNNLGIVHKVSFCGKDDFWHQKECNDAMYVLSSDYEGMPNSLAEAMAIGIPSISTDCPTGGPRELIQDGVNGFLCSINNPVEMANKMVCALNYSEVFYKNTRNMINEYSVQNIAIMWINYIKGISKEVYE